MERDDHTATAVILSQVNGRIITLDEAVCELDGCRVRVTIESAEPEEMEMSAEENLRLWNEWREREDREGALLILDSGSNWE